ncbi:MAG TPA: sulfotransferase [Caulobacteraceae bacterium]|jgi:tetratricopeptide (TPR) repeat protein|nr:sulfotransferase [Caulobacteraceae bacterium]
MPANIRDQTKDQERLDALIAALRAGRGGEALALAEAAVAEGLQHPLPLQLVAMARQQQGRFDEARVLYRRVLDVDPARVEALFSLARLAVETGDWDEADTLAARLARLGADRPDAGWLAARIALGRGDLAAAEAGAARLAANAGLNPEQRAEALLLRAEALDGLGRTAEAFRDAVDGKAIQGRLHAGRAAGREAETDKLNRLAAWFRTTDPDAWRATPAAAPIAGEARTHVFLVGFPRSGTTLLEQLLAGHPEVRTLEEAPTLAGAYAEFLRAPEGLQRLARLPAAEADRWRARYWAEVAARGVDAGGRVFLDKAPAGTLYLPLIARLFPAARVLFAIRDPRDVVLSCLRNNFQMNAMTYEFTSLQTTAACYAACMTMAGVYRGVLPLDLYETRHEALVERFDAELAGLCAFLGLGIDPAMADVGRTAAGRSIRTPSADQVRAGLNRRGLGRWRAYESELAPIMPTLAPWIERFGYGAAG